MSVSYTVYRTQDESSDLLRSCFKRRARDDNADPQQLRRFLNDQFYVVLMRTPYSDIDVEKKGSFDMDAFTRTFRAVATLQELTLVFRLVDDDKSGTVTYGEWQSFHQKFDPEYRHTKRSTGWRREGSP
eukprot:EG_transcript_46532